MRYLFTRWLASLLGLPTSFQDTVPGARPRPAAQHSPLQLFWLAEHLEALAEDPTLPLPSEVRQKCLARIRSARWVINTDPVSATWALRQAFNLIRHPTGA